ASVDSDEAAVIWGNHELQRQIGYTHVTAGRSNTPAVKQEIRARMQAGLFAQGTVVDVLCGLAEMKGFSSWSGKRGPVKHAEEEEHTITQTLHFRSFTQDHNVPLRPNAIVVSRPPERGTSTGRYLVSATRMRSADILVHSCLPYRKGFLAGNVSPF